MPTGCLPCADLRRAWRCASCDVDICEQCYRESRTATPTCSATELASPTAFPTACGLESGCRSLTGSEMPTVLLLTGEEFSCDADCVREVIAAGPGADVGRSDANNRLPRIALQFQTIRNFKAHHRPLRQQSMGSVSAEGLQRTEILLLKQTRRHVHLCNATGPHPRARGLCAASRFLPQGGVHWGLRGRIPRD